jgi:hypothetical protein
MMEREPWRRLLPRFQSATWRQGAREAIFRALFLVGEGGRGVASLPMPDRALPDVLIPRRGSPTRSLPGSFPVQTWGAGDPGVSCPDSAGTEKRHDLFLCELSQAKRQRMSRSGTRRFLL